MTVTAKPMETTLSAAEQRELRKFMRLQHMQQIVLKSERERLATIESLEDKGYIEMVSECVSYYTYALIENK